MKNNTPQFNFTLGEVSLTVSDLNQSVDYYTRIIGLTLLDRTDTTALLGVDGNALIYLVENTSYNYPREAYTGLYHVAILMPHEEDLGQILYHFSSQKYQLDGAGDHMYSQALYMHDPDGHGIEIYVDRPRSEWTINPDGTIESGTAAVDVEHLISLVKEVHWEGMPTGTKVGHVHLQIKDVDVFEKFYIEGLGFDLVTTWHGARFISKYGYHHHIAGNAWAKPKAFLPEGIYGLNSYTLRVDDLTELKEHFSGDSSYTEIDNGFTVSDGNGITVRFVQA